MKKAVIFICTTIAFFFIPFFLIQYSFGIKTPIEKVPQLWQLAKQGGINYAYISTGEYSKDLIPYRVPESYTIRVYYLNQNGSHFFSIPASAATFNYVSSSYQINQFFLPFYLFYVPSFIDNCLKQRSAL